MIHRRHVGTLAAFCIFTAGALPALIPAARGEIPCVIDVLGVHNNPPPINEGLGFTESVDIEGDRIVAGAPREGFAFGAVYVFQRQGNQWVQEARLTESDPSWQDFLGGSVALSGDRVIAGAPHPIIDDLNFGEAWVFRKVGGEWIEEASLIPSIPGLQDFFGYSVAIHDDVAVVGAPFADPSQRGRTFVFRWNGTQWLEEAALAGTGVGEFDYFGVSVALSGARIAVGAPTDYMDDGAPGSVYVFKHNGSTWVQESRVRPNDDETSRSFGNSVALRGDRLVVGASTDRTFSSFNGAVYVFDWDGASWVQQVRLFPPNPVGDVRFGWRVDVAPDIVAATSPGNGLLHIFALQDGNWVQRFALEIGNGAALSDDGALAVIGRYVYGLGAFPPCIPTTSTWGVFIMALGLTAIASIAIRKRIKFRCVCVCVCVAVFGLLGFDDPLFAQVAGLEAAHHPERLIVRYKSGTSQQARAAVPSRHAATLERNDPYVDGLAFVRVAPNDLADQLIALRNDPDVLYAEPDYEVTATATPNDPDYLYGNQWGLAAVHAPQAWNSWTGVNAPDFKVAVIDSGVAYDHPAGWHVRP